jgi:hypothetical protein
MVPQPSKVLLSDNFPLRSKLAAEHDVRLNNEYMEA